MSFKLPSFSSFFSRVSHKVEDEKKSSASKFFTVTSHKTEKSEPKESGFKISQFFHRLFHSKEKARVGVEAAFQKSNASNSVGTHVQATQKNKTALVHIQDISQRTGAPKYFVMLNEHADVPANAETELNRRHEFIESNEGRFMIDIANMGSCIDKPEQYFRSVHGLDLQKILTAAFQIYYEEGKRVHEDSFATPGWGHDPTTQSSENLESLKANLEKISTWRNDEKKLLEKAVDAIDGRIIRLNEERQKARNPS